MVQYITTSWGDKLRGTTSLTFQSIPYDAGMSWAQVAYNSAIDGYLKTNASQGPASGTYYPNYEPVSLSVGEYRRSNPTNGYWHTFQLTTFYSIYCASNNTKYGSVTGGGEEIEAGSSVTFKATPASGCVFLGWDTGETDTTLTITSSSQYDGKTIIASFATTFSILFSPNSGYGAMPQQNFIYGASQKLSVNTFTRDGYVFTEWNTEADGSGQAFADGESVSNLTSVAGGTITLYAQWRQVDFKIDTSFSLPDGAPAQVPEISITPVSGSGMWREGTSVSVSAQIDGLLGIEFDSWNTSGVIVADITKNPLEFTMPSNDVSLTAVYKLKLLKVNHGIDSASEIAADGETSIVDETGSDPEDLVYGDTVTFRAPPAKDGYSFSGWYDGGTRVSQDQNYTATLEDDISLLARYATTVTIGKESEEGADGYFSVNGVAYETQSNVVLSAELGSVISLAAIPVSGYFGGWYSGDAIQNLFREDTVRVLSSDGYVARFVSTAVSVTVKCSSSRNAETDMGSLGTLSLLGDSVTGNGGSSYSVEAFTEVMLVATPSGNPDALPLFRVVENTDSGDVVVDVSAPVRILNVSRSFEAKWGSRGKFTVTVSSADNAAGVAFIGESANVTSLTDEQDSEVTITAIPSNGYRFEGWYVGDEKVSVSAKFTFVLTEGVTLQARFVEDAAAICVWEGSGENKRLSWKSRVFVMPRPFDPVAARVDAVGYPVSLSVGTYSSPDAEPTRDHAVQVQNQSGRRLPRMRSERFLRISVESVHEVDSVVVATNLVEVN